MHALIALKNQYGRRLSLWLLLQCLLANPGTAQDETGNVDPDPANPDATSETETATPTPSASNNNTDSAQQLLADKVPEKEHAWLTVAGHRQLALYIPERSGTVNGGVLLLTNTGEHPSEPGVINALRHTLADHHWYTLALTLGGREGKPADIETAQLAIAAGIKFLNEQGVLSIAILGEGTGAAHAIHYMANLPTDDFGPGGIRQVRALVMINGVNTIRGSDSDLLEKIGEIPLPTLDAYSGSDLNAKEAAMARKKAAKGQKQAQYQQVQLPAMVSYHQTHENQITKRVRGWLDKHAAGFMVQNRRR